MIRERIERGARELAAPLAAAWGRPVQVAVWSAALGLAAALWLRPPLWGVTVVVAVALAAVLGLRVRAPRSALAAAALAVCLTALAVGEVRLEAIARSALVGIAGETRSTVVEVTGPTRSSRYERRAPVLVRAVDGVELSEPAQLELPLTAPAPEQGMRLLLTASIRLPQGPSARSSFDERALLARRGAHVVLRAASYRVLGRRGGLPAIADRLRRTLAARAAPGLEGDRRALVLGIVLGADEDVGDELRDRFRASGLTHLMAVSGQNVAYVIAGVLILFWLAGAGRVLATAVALVAVVGYVAAVGLQPSVVRAGVAGCLACLAWLASRPADRWHFLALGAVALLAWNPHTLLEPGFQLSFAAVAAIFVLVPVLERLLRDARAPARLGAVVALSAGCGLVTAPISWAHFGSVSLVTVPANVLAEPVVAPILGLGLGASALTPILPDAALGMGWVNGWLAAYLAWCARTMGGLPFATGGLWPFLAISAAALIVLLAWRWRGRLGAVVRHPFGRVAAIGLVLAAVAASAIAVRSGGGPPPPQGLRLTFLDVGQGDSALLETPEASVLVDQGPPEARVARQLRALGVEQLDAIVLTHPQLDHVGGAPEVAQRLDVEALLDPELPFASGERDAAVAAARRGGARVIVARAGQVLRLGRLTLRVLWPDGPGRAGEDPNDRAIVLRASYGAVDALLAADAESNVLSRIEIEPVEVLKVSHHGSDDPGLPALLERLDPRVVVISVGADNDYGHPAPSTLAALAARPGLAVFRTDRDGAVRLESDGSTLRVASER